MKRLHISPAFFLTTPTAAGLAQRTRHVALGLLTLAAFLAADPAHAQQPRPLVTVENADAESIRVRVANPTQQPGRVQIVRLATGTTVFADTYAAAAYGHRFNFRNLSAGRYALLMQVGGEAYRYVLQVDHAAAGRGAMVRTVKARWSAPAAPAVLVTAAL